MMSNVDGIWRAVEGPYKGLEAFTENDSDFLFGRDEDRDRLVYSLLSSRLSVLYGAKQVGKSSLLRAGVVNALRRKAVDRCAVVVFDDWSSANVLESLYSAIDRAFEGIGVARQERPDSQPLSFIDRCEHWTKCLGEGGREGELFILLDQFGEHLRNTGINTKPGSFDYEFAKAVSTRGLPVNFLIALRDDLLADLDRYRSTIPGLYSNLIRLEALTSTQAWQAIENPLFETYNKRHPRQKIGIEPQLVGAVLSAVRFGSGGDSAQRFESQVAGDDERFDVGGLQLAMKAVWEREIRNGSPTLRYNTFEHELGGISGIKAQYVKERFESFSPRERHLSARVLDHLIAPGGVGLLPSNLARQAGVKRGELAALTEKLRTQKMIMAGRGARPPRYEMGYPILTPAVIDWVQNDFAERAQAEKQLVSKIERARWLFEETSQLAALNVIINTSEDWLVRADNLEVSQDLEDNLRSRLETIVANLAQDGELQGYKGAVSSIAYGRDGSVIVTGAEDGSVTLWRICPAIQDPVVCKDRHKTWIWALQVSLDGKWLATGSDDGTVVLWAVSDEGLKYARLVVDSGPLVRGLSFGPDSSLLAIARDDGMVRLYDLREGRVLHAFKANSRAVRCVEFSPDGLSLATGADDGTISLWDLNGNLLTRYGDSECAGFRHDAAVWGVRFHPDGKHLASCSQDHHIKLWDLQLGREERTLSGHTSWVLDIQFNSDGSLLASGSEDGTARLWDRRGNQIAEFVHGAPVNGICFSPDDLTLATAAADCRVRVWSVRQKAGPRKPRRFIHRNKPILLDVSFGIDGKLLATGGTDNEVQIWDKDGKIRRPLEGHKGWIMCVVFHPLKSSSLATGSIDGTARLWNIVDGTDRTFDPGDGPVWSVALSPDGRFLATGSNGGKISRWDLHDRKDAPPQPFPSRHGPVWSVRFSPDGKSMAAGCQDGSILTGDFFAGDVTPLKGGHSGQVLSLSFSFSSKGRFLASSSSEGRICIWDFNQKTLKWSEALDAPIWSVTFSPNGDLLASGSVNRWVCLWNLKGKKVREYRTASPVRGLAFSRDGKWLAASCSDGTVRLWPTSDETFESLLIRAKDEWNKALKWPANGASGAVGESGILTSAG
jgi:WD40 repeat protein